MLRRLNIKEKNWRSFLDDLKERKLWDEYQVYYEDVFNITSTLNTPWFTISANDKPPNDY